MSFNPFNPLDVDPIGGAIGGALGFGGHHRSRNMETPDARTSWRHLAPPQQGPMQPQPAGAQGAGAQAFQGQAMSQPQFGPQHGGPMQQQPQASHPAFAGPGPSFTPNARAFRPQGPPTGGNVPLDTYMQGIRPPGDRWGGGGRQRAMPGPAPGNNVAQGWFGDMMHGLFGESTGDYARRINNQGDIAG